jgi:ABC-type uncharacterized transport system ATPase subunit
MFMEFWNITVYTSVHKKQTNDQMNKDVVVIIHKDMLLLQYQGENVTVDHQGKIVPVTWRNVKGSVIIYQQVLP